MSNGSAYHRKMKKLPLLTGLLFLTACNSATKPTDANYIATLNAYFPDHPDCLLDGSVRFPFETGDPTLTKQMDALADAQMLELHRAPIIKITRYTLTDAGAKAGPHFCYGHREVTAIVSSTPPVVANGLSETTVVYRYKIEDMPVWAKTPQVVAAYPTLAHEATGDATGTITLAQNRVGWVVPD
jgi:hypothetical protein